MKNNWHWSESEIQKLKELYPKTQRQDLEKIFSKSNDAIRKKAARLGLDKCETFCQKKDKTYKLCSDAKKLIELYEDGSSIRKIAKNTQTCMATIKKILTENNFEQKDKSNAHRKYKLNENYFDKIDSEKKAYFLGFIFADGFIYRGKNFELGIHIHPKDIEILHMFKEELESESPIKIDKKGYALFRVYSKHLFEQLKKLGCVERKSLVLEFPKINEEFLNHFIRGYFDGDGTIKRSSKRERSVQVGFASSNSFILSLRNLLKEKNKMGLVNPYKKGNYSELMYSGKGNAKKMFSYLYNNATVFLKRKHKRFITYLNLPHESQEESQDLLP